MWNSPYCQCYLGLLLLLFSAWMPSNVSSQRPSVVNVGALVAYDSTIGRVAKAAMELAVTNVNNNSTLLGGTNLQLTMMDSNCSAFKGTVAAVELLKEDVVAIVGPQLSVHAHVLSHLANQLQIPVLSFAATDPALTSSQYPYFIRMAHNDFSQMAAIAALAGYYGWTEVVAVYADDDYGRNGISVLEDTLEDVAAKISNKAAIPHGCSQSEMGNILAKLALVETRVFVVHMNSDDGLKLFAGAKAIGMLNAGYAWMATDWLSSVLDSTVLATDDMKSLEGVIGLRRHSPDSENYKEFIEQWKSLQSAQGADASLNVFGLYAYDSIFMMAHSINSFLDQGGSFSFVDQSTVSSSGSDSQLEALKIFEGGEQLKKIILGTNFTGVVGPVQLDLNRDLMGSTFEIINIADTGSRSIGYWSANIGLSATPPENSHAINSNQSDENPKLPDIMWPGASKEVPRGWAISNKVGEFVIGVPRELGFTEIVTISNDTSQMPSGYCIDVFLAALNLLPYRFPYKFVPFGTGESTPNYDNLVDQVISKNFDAAVGDISIVTTRSKVVDFTQPFEQSGLVVVVPYKQNNSDRWAFLGPFTLGMWCTIIAFFVFIGIVVWILEHRSNPEFRGHPKDQVMNVLWFAFSTMFFAQRENTVSSLARVVLILWLFVVLIINSTYTASLTSILTVQQLEPTIGGIESLASAKLPIGYHAGSYVGDYLSKEFKIPKHNLIALDTKDDYVKALSLGPKKGGVAAIVDEHPYIESFLSTRCQYQIVGTEFTKTGWGFVYPKDSRLAIDMSTSILSLQESGDLQKIHNKWLKKRICSEAALSGDSNQFGLDNFWGLFLVIGIVGCIALLIYFLRLIWQFTHSSDTSTEEAPAKTPSFGDKSAKVLKSFASFVNEREDNEKTLKLRREASNKKMDPESERESRPV